MLSPRRPRRLAALALLPITLACRDTAAALGASPAEATASADTLLAALAARFGRYQSDARFAAERPVLTREALTPSDLFDRRDLWTGASGSTRDFDLRGGGAPGAYRITVDTDPPVPAAPGEYRKLVHLARLEKDVYQWAARDELAIGRVPVERLAVAYDALFAAASSRDERSVREEYRTRLPFATQSLARLFTLDTLRLTPAAGGAADVLLGITVHPRDVSRAFPALARYADKYVSPASYHIRAVDDAGREWWRSDFANEHATIALRVRGDHLVPLGGAATDDARIPDRLHLVVDVHTKVGIFGVGFRQLTTDLELERTPHEKGFVLRFQREPDWQLPPLVEQMLHAPLQRPFAGNGALLSFSLRDDAAPQTLAIREYHVTVQESRIMRWFGALGNSSLTDFRNGAEQDADLFLEQSLQALRTDLGRLLQE